MADAEHPQTRDLAPTGGDERHLGVLIVDDQAVVREGLRRIVAQRVDMIILGEASTGPDALALVGRRRPDVVVIDSGLAGPGGLETARRIHREHPEVQMLILAEDASPDLIREARAAGAAGFVVNDASAAVIAEALSAVGAGRPYTDPRLAADTPATTPTAHRAVLTARELQVLQLLADGATNRDVCDELHLGAETVKSHVAHILAKLKASQRSQAVAIALRDGLIR